MPGAGLEPARGCPQGILSPQCLPFHHLGLGVVQIYKNFKEKIENLKKKVDLPLNLHNNVGFARL